MKWTWTINIVTVVCDLNKVGLKALIYCHHGVKWDGTLGLRQRISYLISSNNSHPSNNRLPQITPTLWAISLSFIPSLLLFGYYSRKYGIVWNSWYFFSTTYTQQEYCIFSVPTVLYFITLQCTSWLNHLLSSSHKHCTSTYCLKYNFFEGSS